ncbi:MULTISPECIES: RICIN domain-containing protein [unclassified Streptomyces]|uniref:RICIN domain-containing protein n=3 Tax=Streptomyces TaxID=1883 RepID=UPI002B1E4657|nr:MULTISPECIES: RICIN domain-containing protein [unclassified Streptomyces]
MRGHRLLVSCGALGSPPTIGIVLMASLLSPRCLGSLTGAALMLALGAGVPSSVAAPASRAANEMCLDAGNNRNNGDHVRIWRCVNHTNQRYVITNGQIKVEDTMGKRQEMCLDAGNTRNNGDRSRIWQCVNHTNQKWIVRNAQIVLADTMGKRQEMCLDAGNTRNNGDHVRIWQCVNHTNQKWVIQRGYIKVADTI